MESNKKCCYRPCARHIIKPRKTKVLATKKTFIPHGLLNNCSSNKLTSCLLKTQFPIQWFNLDKFAFWNSFGFPLKCSKKWLYHVWTKSHRFSLISNAAEIVKISLQLGIIVWLWLGRRRPSHVIKYTARDKTFKATVVKQNLAKAFAE